MKRYGYLLAVVVLQTMGLVWLSGMTVSAASCENVSGYGAVRLGVPELPYSGDYSLWVRMQSSESNAKALIELNQTDCYEIITSDLKSGKWSWVNYQLQGKPAEIRLEQNMDYSIKLIGVTEGLKVDSVMFGDPQCVPQSLGENCSVAVAAENIRNSDIIELPPLSQKELSGKVFLSKTPEQNVSQLESVNYTVQGKTLQKSKTALPFDTTLLENGVHTVLITTRLTNGEVINESIDINVENSESILSPLVRWFRLRERSVLIIATVVVSVLLAFVLAIWMRQWYIRRRERHFHGF